MNVEGLITDLAFILLLGAVVTVVFKAIRQPVVLGYIVAGFLASPHFKYLPSVANEENIEFWAQIGIVVLLFSLGLEFSFKKLVNSGGSAVVTALVIITGMMISVFGIGKLMGFNDINALFLGGMLSIIIIKALTDMGMRQKKFATHVLAVLIVEDLFAVLMMVILSSMAINKSVEGSELLYSVGKLVFFLVIWFAVGVYVLPSSLNGIRRHLNGETLLVVSMGLCLGMAVFSVYCGFSLALGAFVMGSILAGTSYAERIEHVVTPVKDLFGSVFFISVGMMVQPEVLVKYWMPILILALTVIVGMIIFGSLGMLLTGQTLKMSIESGFCLTQIGEFAFIIATLGMSLGVLDTTIYPIVVAVSVITTFLTPYFIKMADPAYDRLERRLPRQLHFLVEGRGQAGRDGLRENPWMHVLKDSIGRTLLYIILLVGIIVIAHNVLLPICIRATNHWTRLLCAIGTVLVMSPFLVALMMPLKAGQNPGVSAETTKVPRIVMTFFRFLIAIGLVCHAVTVFYSVQTGMMAAIAAVVLLVLVFSKRVRRNLLRIENRFMDNLNERELRRSGKKNAVVYDLHKAYMTVGTACSFVGERLMDSDVRSRYGVNIAGIQRGQQYIPIPVEHIDSRPDLVFQPGDILWIVGNSAKLNNMK